MDHIMWPYKSYSNGVCTINGISRTALLLICCQHLTVGVLAIFEA